MTTDRLVIRLVPSIGKATVGALGGPVHRRPASVLGHRLRISSNQRLEFRSCPYPCPRSLGRNSGAGPLTAPSSAGSFHLGFDEGGVAPGQGLLLDQQDRVLDAQQARAQALEVLSRAADLQPLLENLDALGQGGAYGFGRSGFARSASTLRRFSSISWRPAG